MSYDRMWLCPNLNRETWVESGWHAANICDPKFSTKFGTYDVSTSAGENFAFDELYRFLTLEDAQRFYDADVAGRELIDGHGHEHAIGFQEIRLMVNGQTIATRAISPRPALQPSKVATE